jgi:hypothetical protein
LHLKDEVAVLKGEKKRPKFKPSRMHEEAGKAGAPDRQQQTKPARRGGKPSRSKSVRKMAHAARELACFKRANCNAAWMGGSRGYRYE